MRMGSELSRTAKFALALAFASLAGAMPSAYAQDAKVTIVVPNPSAINNFPLHVAIGEGYFKEQGLDVTVEAVNGSASVLQIDGGRSGADRQSRPRSAARRARPRRGRGLHLQPVPQIDLRPRGEGGIDGHRPRPTSRARRSASAPPTARRWASAAPSCPRPGSPKARTIEFLAVGDGGTAAAAFLNNEVAVLCGRRQRRGDHRVARHPAARDHAGRSSCPSSAMAGP